MFAVTCLLPSVLYLPKCAVFAGFTACGSLSSVQYGNKSTLFPLILPTQSAIKK